MRYVRALLMTIVSVLLISNTEIASAISTVPSDGVIVETDSPIIITGYSFTASRPNYIQLFNSSDTVISIDDWELTYQIGASTYSLGTLAGLVAPSKYVVIADTALLPTATFTFSATPPGSSDTSKIEALHIIPSDTYLNHDVTTPAISGSTPHEPTLPETYYLQRNISTSTGNYLSTFSFLVPSTSFQLLMDPLYQYPNDMPLQITEIVANARNCSPLDTAIDCRDYVKVYNPTAGDINLSDYRLRNGYLGQTSSSSNTFSLSGVIQSGHYAVFSVNVTNSGGWLWFEDAYGLQRYDNTVTEYPDASADSKKGHAWAYDSSDDSWKWTSVPTPYNKPSYFPPPPIEVAKATDGLKPCREGQYRSEETNRCRSVVSALSDLVPCKEGQARNPATNRCRSIVSLANSLTPCRENQERNPTTNRCRNVVKNVPDAAFSVEPIKETGKAFAGWWALGGVGILASGYAGWEWRREVAGLIRKVISPLSSSK